MTDADLLLHRILLYKGVDKLLEDLMASLPPPQGTVEPRPTPPSDHGAAETAPSAADRPSAAAVNAAGAGVASPPADGTAGRASAHRDSPSPAEAAPPSSAAGRSARAVPDLIPAPDGTIPAKGGEEWWRANTLITLAGGYQVTAHQIGRNIILGAGGSDALVAPLRQKISNALKTLKISGAVTVKGQGRAAKWAITKTGRQMLTAVTPGCQG